MPLSISDNSLALACSLYKREEPRVVLGITAIPANRSYETAQCAQRGQIKHNRQQSNYETQKNARHATWRNTITFPYRMRIRAFQLKPQSAKLPRANGLPLPKCPDLIFWPNTPPA